MSLEHYAIHIAPKGGTVDKIVDEVAALRLAAAKQRTDYSRSKGAVGVYASESSVSGLLFKDESSIPEGWSVYYKPEGCDSVVALPAKAKDRTKAARAAAKAIKDEVAALPALPGASLFTRKIGASEVITAGDSGRFSLRGCYYHRLGDTTFVMTPWTTKADEAGENVGAKAPTEKTRIAFHPEGCERVAMSVFYAAKEKFEAETKAAA
jgi:hypothetical protein